MSQSDENSKPPQTPFEVWAVSAPGTLRDPMDGFLVSTRDRLPQLIAYLDGCDEVSLLGARLIAAGKRSPESASMDLRGREVPQWLGERFLLPLELIGVENSPYLVATFIFTSGRKCGFTLLSTSAVALVDSHLEGNVPEGEGDAL